jgi:hypothetical protein
MPNGVSGGTESPDSVHNVFDALAHRVPLRFISVATEFDPNALERVVGGLLIRTPSLVAQHD